MTKSHFKLEYLSVGSNQPDAFTISVNPLIPSHLPLLFPFEPLADDFVPVPRCSQWLVPVLPRPLSLFFSAMKKKELPPDPGFHFPGLTINPWLFFTLLIPGTHLTALDSHV